MIERAGLPLVKSFEGLCLSPYICSGGIATIGYGSTWYFGKYRVNLGDPSITKNEAELLLKFGYDIRERWVLNNVMVPLTANQLGALTSWVYNIGRTNAGSSTLIRVLNRGDYHAASCEFWKWRRAAGRILAGLVRRRESERVLFNTP